MALSAFLEQPSPQPTLFYLLDKLERFSGANPGEARLPSTADLVRSQASQEATVLRQIEDALVYAWNSGLIEVYPQDAIGLTPAGRWYVNEGRRRRVALWKVNAHLDAAEICARVTVEDGHGPVSELPLDQVRKSAPTAPPPQRASRKRGRPSKVGAVWLPLLMPMQPPMHLQQEGSGA